VETRRPLVVEIKRNSLDDGPGIRTAVFFKGCPLRCVWCHNPETLSPDPEIAWFKGNCLSCGQCADVCRNGAVKVRIDGPGKKTISYDKTTCITCGKCAESCPSGARKIAGVYYTTESLCEYLVRDMPFYRNSGGGVTLSGGEPTLFMDYTSELLRLLKTRGVDTLVETCGLFAFDRFMKSIMPFADKIFFDIKIHDPDLHRKFTGTGNGTIMENLRRLSLKNREKILPRIPLIPGITANEDNISRIGGFLREIGFRQAVLIPYNPLWLEKADAVGRQTEIERGKFMSLSEVEKLKEILDCAIG